MDDGKIRCKERECGSNVAGWCQQETLPKDCLKVREDRERLIYYASRLAVVLHGCTAGGCPFAKHVRGGIGTANICRCGEDARAIVNAISERIPNVADHAPRPPASGGAPRESALLGGAGAPTGDADGIRHTERALLRPLSAEAQRPAVAGTLPPLVGGSGSELSHV